jgi:predicted ATPase/DNA-binding winged helix-turn-helix (wHTH) protein
MPTRGQLFVSGAWHIDPDRRELRAQGALIPIGGRAFEILVVLVQAAGELVTKDELLQRIWPGAIAADGTLQVHISAVRRALGPDRGMLKTVSGRGYRLTGDWALRKEPLGEAAKSESEAPPARPFVTNLPAPLARLIGREDAVAQLAELVSAYRTVTLAGPGGIGKTALALEVARNIFPGYGGDAWLVELAGLSDAALVPSAAVAALGLKLGSGEISPELVARCIGASKLLMVLDNCEHVIDAAARFVETVVRLCPRATVLATSREVLRIEGEYVYRVPPLEVPSPDEQEPSRILRHGAVQLFVERTKAAHAAFPQSADDVRAIAAVCRRLDGIPLALEFAAARVATLGLSQVVAHLDDRFALLTGGRRTALPRHQTLRATLDWSYQLLPEREQSLLRRLAIFAGGFTPEAVVEIAGDLAGSEAVAIDAIASLVAKSLVTRDGTAAALRWRLLETIRAYALEKLNLSSEAAQVAQRHARFFCDLIAQATLGMTPSASADALARHAQEIDNVRAALDWCFSPHGDVATGVVLAAAYVRVWLHLALADECRDRTQRALDALAASPDIGDTVRMWLHLGHGLSQGYTAGPPERAREMAAAALEAAERLGDPGAQLMPFYSIWSSHFHTGDIRAAEQVAQRLSRVALRLDDADAMLFADRLAGAALLFGGSLHAARTKLAEGVERAGAGRARKYPLGSQHDQHVLARSMLAMALWIEGLADDASARVAACLGDASGEDSRSTLCSVLRDAACRVPIMSGDFATGEQRVAQLIDVATANNFRQYVQAGRCFQGMLLIKRGEHDAGTALLRDALDDCSTTGWTAFFPEFLGVLAAGLGGLGQIDAGLDTIAQALAWAERGGERWYVPELLRVKGELLLRLPADRSAASAEECLNEALTLARQQGALSWELRAAASLARMKAGRDSRDEARETLAPVYAKFTEGFATADLRAARALLESLRRP